MCGRRDRAANRDYSPEKSYPLLIYLSCNLPKPDTLPPSGKPYFKVHVTDHKMLAFPGLFVRGASGRQRYNVLGAVNPLTLVLDNAAYQRCQLVRHVAQELNIELLFLPSYSPNLNLIERLWKFVKKQALHSRHHTNYIDFQAAIDTCLDQLNTTHKPAVASLLTLKFQTIQNVPLLTA